MTTIQHRAECSKRQLSASATMDTFCCFACGDESEELEELFCGGAGLEVVENRLVRRELFSNDKDV